MIVYKVFKRISPTELASMTWKMEAMPQQPLLIYKQGELARPKPKCGALAAYRELEDAMFRAEVNLAHGQMEVWKCSATSSRRRPRLSDFGQPIGVLFSSGGIDGTSLCTDYNGKFESSVVPCARITPLEKVWPL